MPLHLDVRADVWNGGKGRKGLSSTTLRSGLHSRGLGVESQDGLTPRRWE